MVLAEGIYALTRSFPREEAYGMTSQMRRAAASVAANMAEGYGRDMPGNFINHLRIAQGSLKEVETFLELSARVGLSRVDEVSPLLGRSDDVGRMLLGLIRSVQARG